MPLSRGAPASSKSQLGKTRTAGTAPGTIVSAAVRQVAQLHKARLAIEDGATIDEAAGGIQPFVALRSPADYRVGARGWTSKRLEQAMTQLADAALEARRQAAIAELVTQRALLTIAMAARRNE